MHSFKLKTARVAEIAQLIDLIPTKDLGTMKEIRLASGLVKDLQKAIKEVAEKASDLRYKQGELLKSEGISERFIEQSKKMTDEEKEELQKKVDHEFRMLCQEKFKQEFAEIEVLNLEIVEVELGNDEYTKLKELFEKYCVVQYRDKEALIEIADALGV